MNGSEQEAQVLDRIVPQLEAEGYTVYVHPSPQLLPQFMQGYLPDAIALGSPKNLAIEIKLEGRSADEQLERIRSRFQNAKDWEFRLYLARPVSTRNFIGISSRVDIEASLRTIEKLISDQQTQPAFLLAWATFEALGRALTPEKFARPQTPGRLVEVLASEGFITPTEADALRRLADTRNRFIHGDLKVAASRAEMDQFLSVLRTLLSLVPGS